MRDQVDDMRATLRDLGQRIGIAGELLAFLWHRRLWWLVPLVSVMLLLGLLLAFASATGVGPAIYTLF
jgi:hypothetical protein